MLRRAYYSGEAARFHSLALRTYKISIGSLVIAWLMGVVWWVFRL